MSNYFVRPDSTKESYSAKEFLTQLKNIEQVEYIHTHEFRVVHTNQKPLQEA